MMENIRITKLIVSPFNVRSLTKREINDELASLKQSIQSNGIIEPLIVRPNGNHYEIVVGQRRFVAAQQLGLKEVPCIVKKLTDQQAIEYSLIENLQRKDVDDIDVAEGLKKWFDEESIRKYGKSAPDLPITMEVTSKLANIIGLSDRQIRSYLSLVSLAPEVKEMVSEGKITIESGAKLKQLDEEAQKEFAEEFSKVLEEKPITQMEEEEAVDRVRKGEDIKEVMKDIAESVSPEYIVIVLKSKEGSSQFKMRRKYYDWLGEVAKRRNVSTLSLLEEIVVEKLKEWGYQI